MGQQALLLIEKGVEEQTIPCYEHELQVEKQLPEIVVLIVLFFQCLVSELLLPPRVAHFELVNGEYGGQMVLL